MKTIIVEKYNPVWKVEFQKAKNFYDILLQDIAVEIVHVGSTSIEGMWAKPILDIDIIVNSDVDSERAIESLKSVGYHHLGDLGVAGREAFEYSSTNHHIQWMSHNLYVCMRGSENLENHLLLKKHLLKNKESVAQYSNLKRKLAKKYPHDIDAYIAEKTELITAFLKAEGMDVDALDRIEALNKKEV